MRITQVTKADSPRLPQKDCNMNDVFDNCAVVLTDSDLDLCKQQHHQHQHSPPVYNIPMTTEPGKNVFVPMATKIRKHFDAGNHKRRLVQKAGECNVTSCNVTKRKLKYLVDIFTTLVDMKWRFHFLMFAAAFVVTWCAFALAWFCIAVAHGDHLNYKNDSWNSCVDNVYDYSTALLFSIETQTTIGYGYRVVQAECGFAIFVLMLQSLVGTLIQSLITGIIFAKISRPKGRSQTIMFSEKAVICKRDNEYNLLFRVGDMRKSHIIGTSIRAVLVKNRLTTEGESIPLCQFPLHLETEMSQTDSFVFFIWPVTVVHRINEKSPLWDMSLESLWSDHFEIIVLLEGTIESTGMSTQVRTSYIPIEIMWGERLVPLLTYQLENGRYEIDYRQFHNTTSMKMPECSAREYAENLKQGVDEGTLKLDSEYFACFTAPAVRQAHHNFPSRSLHNLFHKKKLNRSSGNGFSNGVNKKSSKKPHPYNRKKILSESDGLDDKKDKNHFKNDTLWPPTDEKNPGLSNSDDSLWRRAVADDKIRTTFNTVAFL